MNETDAKVSMWAKLYKRWEKVESDLPAGKTRPAAEVGMHLSAMEIELRAMSAKVDTAFNEASGALHNKPAATARNRQQDLR